MNYLYNRSKPRQKRSSSCMWTPCATCPFRCAKTETLKSPVTCLSRRSIASIRQLLSISKTVTRQTISSKPLCRNTSRPSSLSAVEAQRISAKWQQIANCKIMGHRGQTSHSYHPKSKMRSNTSRSRECSY